MVVKNGHGFFGLGTLESQDWIDEMSWFFACWYKLRKVNSGIDNYWQGIVKNGWGLIDHGTLKSWGTPSVVHSQNFKEKFPLRKSDPKIGFFLYFEKFCHWFLLVCTWKIEKLILFRVRLNGSWVVIHNKVLNFYDWNLCYELFHDSKK